jgi:hypothetical protein
VTKKSPSFGIAQKAIEEKTQHFKNLFISSIVKIINHVYVMKKSLDSTTFAKGSSLLLSLNTLKNKPIFN